MSFEHDHPFDPTYGYDQEQMLALRAPETPADFKSFWEVRRAKWEGYAHKLIPTGEPTTEANVRIETIRIERSDGVPIDGWMKLPEGGDVRHLFVYIHGYGGFGGPWWPLLLPNSAGLFIGCRGLPPSFSDLAPSDAGKHVLHGIQSRDTYVFADCAEDIWSAAEVILRRFPTADSLNFIGESFGGGLGALALPWEPRFKAAYFGVPSFGNYPLRVQLPCAGSGEPVRLHHQEHPEVMEVLQYFDAAVAARFIDIPTMVMCALFDPAVPPPGQFTVYNELAGHKELYVMPAGHFDWPTLEADQAAKNRAITTFFQQQLQGAS